MGAVPITVVLPVLNEATALPRLLPALQAAHVDQVVVVDGGSTDGTPEIARAAGVCLVETGRGRGPQLNAGALAATGQLLWFLHADSVITPACVAALRAAKGPWGCFAVAIDSADPRLGITGAFMTRRAQLTGSCTGDMGIWAQRSFFVDLGGFAPLSAFEDMEFSDRARARARPEVLLPAIGTSARRWTGHGINRTIARLWALRLGYRLGLDPVALAQRYTSQPRAS